MDDSEDQLVARAVALDESALTTLLQQTGPEVRAHLTPTISKKWQTVLDADDVMQVTYLEAFLRIGHFTPRGPGSFAAWLTRIAQNNLRDAITELERLKRPHPDRRVVPAQDGDTAVALFEGLACTTSTPSRLAGRLEIQQAVNAALARLPDDYATVVRQYDLEGRPAAEVGASLGRSEGAVYMLRARAHDRLREAFASESSFFTTPS